MAGSTSKEKQKLSLPLDIVGNCGPIAIAAILFDLRHRGQIADAQLQALLPAAKRYFPQQDFIALLDSNSLKAIHMLAYVLRQYGVDQIEADPGRFRGAFCDITEGTNPTSMRQTNTWMDHMLASAIFSGLKIPADVSLNLGKQTVLIPLYRGKNPTAEKATLHLSGGHYQAVVDRSFAKPLKGTTRPTNIIQPLAAHPAPPTQSDIDSRTLESDAKIIARQDSASAHFSEHSTKELIAIYKAAMQRANLDGQGGNVSYLHGAFLQAGRELLALAVLQDQVVEGGELKSQLIHVLSRQASFDQAFYNDVMPMRSQAKSCGQFSLNANQEAPVHVPAPIACA